MRIQSSSGSVRAQQRTPGEEAIDEEELEQEERLRTLGTRTRAVQPCAERTSMCAALRMSICVLACLSPCEQSESITALHYGESEDPAKMAYSIMALMRRDLGDNQTNSNEHERVPQTSWRTAVAVATHACSMAAAEFERSSAHPATTPSTKDSKLEDTSAGRYHNLQGKVQGYTKELLPGSSRGAEPDSRQETTCRNQHPKRRELGNCLEAG